MPSPQITPTVNPLPGDSGMVVGPQAGSAAQGPACGHVR